MEHMDWFEFATIVLAAIMALVGIGLVVLSRKNLGGVLLGLTLMLWGAGTLVGTLWAQQRLGWTPSLALASVLAWVISGGTLVGFSVVYPRIILERRHLVGLGITATATALLAGYVLANGARWLASGQLIETGYAITYLPPSVGMLAVLLLLGYRWLTSPPGARRTQIAWGLLPFAYWALVDGLDFTVYPFVFGTTAPWQGLSDGRLWTYTLVVLVLATVVVAILFAVAMLRVFRGRPAADDRALAFVILYLLPFSLLTVSEAFPPARLFAAIAWPTAIFLVVYGVARYNLVGLDLKFKWTLKRGTLAAVFVAVFFIASELAKLIFEGVAGSAVIGILATGALVFAIAPLQRAAQRLADRAMPRVQDSPAYLDDRRATIYRAQVETLLADGHISVKERRALLRLQADLGLEAEQANRVEAEVLDALEARR